MTSMTTTTSKRAFPDSHPTETVIYASATRGYFDISAFFPNDEAAEAFEALFPKSVKVKRSTFSQSVRENGQYVGTTITPTRSVYANLAADGVNGGRNETGIRRVRRALKVLADNGIDFIWATPYSSNFPTFEAFEAFVTTI